MLRSTLSISFLLFPVKSSRLVLPSPASQYRCCLRKSMRRQESELDGDHSASFQYFSSATPMSSLPFCIQPPRREAEWTKFPFLFSASEPMSCPPPKKECARWRYICDPHRRTEMNDAHEPAVGHDIPRCKHGVRFFFARACSQFIDFFPFSTSLLFHLYHFPHLLLHNRISWYHLLITRVSASAEPKKPPWSDRHDFIGNPSQA